MTRSAIRSRANSGASSCRSGRLRPSGRPSWPTSRRPPQRNHEGRPRRAVSPPHPLLLEGGGRWAVAPIAGEVPLVLSPCRDPPDRPRCLSSRSNADPWFCRREWQLRGSAELPEGDRIAGYDQSGSVQSNLLPATTGEHLATPRSAVRVSRQQSDLDCDPSPVDVVYGPVYRGSPPERSGRIPRQVAHLSRRGHAADRNWG